MGQAVETRQLSASYPLPSKCKCFNLLVNQIGGIKAQELNLCAQTWKMRGFSSELQKPSNQKPNPLLKSKSALSVYAYLLGI